jgi:hypothetical protein
MKSLDPPSGASASPMAHQARVGSTRHTLLVALSVPRRHGTRLSNVTIESGTHQASSGATLAPRLRRTLELAYAVDGVVAVRVWQWGSNVAIGVRGSATSSPADLIRRVEAAVAGLREPGEAWDLGMLQEPTTGASEEAL